MSTIRGQIAEAGGVSSVICLPVPRPKLDEKIFMFVRAGFAGSWCVWEQERWRGLRSWGGMGPDPGARMQGRELASTQGSGGGEDGETGGAGAGEVSGAVHTRTLHVSVHMKVPQGHPKPVKVWARD